MNKERLLEMSQAIRAQSRRFYESANLFGVWHCEADVDDSIGDMIAMLLAFQEEIDEAREACSAAQT